MGDRGGWSTHFGKCGMKNEFVVGVGACFVGEGESDRCVWRSPLLFTANKYGCIFY